MIDATGTLFIDNSTMKSVARCSTEALTRYGFGLTSPEEKAVLKQGSAGHAAVAHYLRTNDSEQAIEVYANGSWCEACGGSGASDDPNVACSACEGSGRGEPGYEAWADENVMPGDRLTFANTKLILEEWFRRYPPSQIPFGVNPELIEIGFSYPLTADGFCVCGHDLSSHPGITAVNPERHGNCTRCDCPAYTPVIFVGRMDGIVVNPQDSGWYVLENKFTGSITPNWIKQYKLDSQLSGYIWAAQQHTERPVLGAFVNAIQVSKLPSSERKCTKHGVLYEECGMLHMESQLFMASRQPEALVEWRRTALHLADRFRRLLLRFPDISMLHRVRMQGTFHNACAYCAMYDFCSVGRPLDRVHQMLVYEPWEPWKHAMGETPTTGRKP